jgi:hypothetical protein
MTIENDRPALPEQNSAGSSKGESPKEGIGDSHRDEQWRRAMAIILGEPLGQFTFGFMFLSSSDDQPIVIFPGDSYLETIERMGFDVEEIRKAGGRYESVKIPCCHGFDESVDFRSLSMDTRGQLASLLSNMLVAGMLIERAYPRWHAAESSLELFTDRRAP